jgi:hypothetical protein
LHASAEHIIPEILLATNEDNWEAVAEMHHLRDPLLLNVFKGIRRVEGEADQNDVGIGIRQRA